VDSVVTETGVRRAPRVGPGRLRELGIVNWALCRLLSKGAGVPDAHIFSTLGRRRGLFRAWLLFAGRLMRGGTLRRSETELVILRVANVRGCRYELEHHVRLGRRAGLDDETVRRVETGPAAPGWSERQRALLLAVDALLTTRDLDDDTWRALREHLREEQVVELCLLVGHYDMLATTIAALGIGTDFGSRHG
jgi:AhpD family alkylhydroperoxidase